MAAAGSEFMSSFSADDFDGARLRALLPCLLSETDFGSNLEPIEGIVEDAIAMEIKIPAVLCLEEAVPFLLEELDDPPMRRTHTAFDLAPLSARIVLNLPPRLTKGIVNGEIDVFVSGMLRWISSDHELLAGHSEIDADVIDPPLAVMLMRRLHDYPAPHDPSEKPIQLRRPAADARLNGVGPIQPPERDL